MGAAFRVTQRVTEYQPRVQRKFAPAAACLALSEAVRFAAVVLKANNFVYVYVCKQCAILNYHL